MGKLVHTITAGQRFGRLTVTDGYEWIQQKDRRRKYVKTICECGRPVLATTSDLANGRMVSCGCWSAERTSARFSTLKGTRGYSRHPLYQTWYTMMKRCNNPSSPVYDNYGGRGIRVAAEWEDCSAFIAYVEQNMGPRPDRHTLDRIDNDGNYEPGNIRWATQSEQNYNRAPMGSRRKG